MDRRIIIFRRYAIGYHPNTGKTIVHLHGRERRCLGLIQSRHYENLHLPYIANEPAGQSVKRAMDASPQQWHVSPLARMMYGIK